MMLDIIIDGIPIALVIIDLFWLRHTGKPYFLIAIGIYTLFLLFFIAILIFRG